jgi:hypothetical protein
LAIASNAGDYAKQVLLLIEFEVSGGTYTTNATGME